MSGQIIENWFVDSVGNIVADDNDSDALRKVRAVIDQFETISTDEIPPSIRAALGDGLVVATGIDGTETLVVLGNKAYIALMRLGEETKHIIALDTYSNILKEKLLTVPSELGGESSTVVDQALLQAVVNWVEAKAYLFGAI